MTTIAKYKRRTFKDVAAEAYARGWSEGREEARKEFEEAYRLLSKHDTDAQLENAMLRNCLDNVSLRKLAWSRITGLFRNRDDRMA
jgi:flagellar biosynthesis/type III secretory pathway protein FliH